MKRSYERVGASMRRAPYVWLAVTFLAMLLMYQPLEVVAEDANHASTPIALVAVVVAALGVAMWVALPNRLESTGRAVPSDDLAAVVQWALAVYPFLICWATVAAGGQQWALLLGQVVSVVLVILTVRRLRRAAGP